MIKSQLLIILAFSVISFIHGQNNETYIATETGDIGKLISKGNLAEGVIYFVDDTLKTKLLTFKGKRKVNYYLFCISLQDDDSLYVYRPSDIIGYEIKDMKYISHYSDGDKFFIKHVKKGKVDLYERRSLPSDNRFLYYLKFPHNPDFYVINPTEKNITVHEFTENEQSKSSSNSFIYFQSKGIHEKFKIFIYNHMSDCSKVANMVSAEFYTINDIPNIVEAYNKCFEQ